MLNQFYVISVQQYDVQKKKKSKLYTTFYKKNNTHKFITIFTRRELWK